jgi:hypothetical protein
LGSCGSDWSFADKLARVNCSVVAGVERRKLPRAIKFKSVSTARRAFGVGTGEYQIGIWPSPLEDRRARLYADVTNAQATMGMKSPIMIGAMFEVVTCYWVVANISQILSELSRRVMMEFVVEVFA